MAKDIELEFLKAIGLGEREADEPADFGIKGDGKTAKLLFNNKIEPVLSIGDYTAITVGLEDFTTLTQTCRLYLDGLWEKKRQDLR